MISRHSFGYFGLYYSDDTVSGDTIEPSSRDAQDNSDADEGACLRCRLQQQHRNFRVPLIIQAETKAYYLSPVARIFEVLVSHESRRQDGSSQSKCRACIKIYPGSIEGAIVVVPVLKFCIIHEQDLAYHVRPFDNSATHSQGS